MHTKMYATPHWVERRHGWEPVKKYTYLLSKDWLRVSTKASRAREGMTWSSIEKCYADLKKSMPTKTKAPLRFEYWKSKRNKQWYWRIRAGNAEPIAHGEGYKRKSGVLKVFHLLFNFEATPDCVDVTPVKWGKINRPWPG